jgi:MFS family permease
VTDEQKKSSKVLGVILLTVFLDLVGFSIIFPLFPDMLEYYLGKELEGGMMTSLISLLEELSGFQGEKARFAATVLFGGILGSLYSLLQFISAPIWGALSDRRGRRTILVITVAGTALSYLMWVMAAPFLLLIVSRAFGGVMAGNLSVATAAVADVTDESNRAKGMGMLGAAFGVGFIIGPALGGLASLVDLTQVLSFIPGINPFSFPALISLVLATINLVWIVRVFPETVSDKTREAAAHAKRPLNPAVLLKPTPFPGVNRTNLTYFIYITAFAGMEFTLTFLAKDRFQYTAEKNVLIFLFVGFIIAFVQGGLVRRLAPKYGERKLVSVGLGMVIPGLALIGYSTNTAMLYGGLFLMAFGSALATPSLTALVSLYAPDERQGEVLGVFRSLGSLGRAFAPIVAAFVYWRFGSAWPYFGAAAIMGLPIMIALSLPIARPLDADS